MSDTKIRELQAELAALENSTPSVGDLEPMILRQMAIRNELHDLTIIEPHWPQPISVEDRLPDGSTRETFILMYGTCRPNFDGSTVTRWWLGMYSSSSARWVAFDNGSPQINDVTHWLPLPPTPSEG